MHWYDEEKFDADHYWGLKVHDKVTGGCNKGSSTFLFLLVGQ